MLDPPRRRHVPRCCPQARAKEHSERGGQVEHLRQQGVFLGGGMVATSEGDWVRRIAEAWALPSGRVGWVGVSRVGGSCGQGTPSMGRSRLCDSCLAASMARRVRGWARARWHCGDRRERASDMAWHGIAWHGATANAGVPRPRRLSLSLSLYLSARTAQQRQRRRARRASGFPSRPPDLKPALGSLSAA
jgi:hypothetical protein